MAIHKKDIAIMGGGPTGSVAALALAQKGFHVVLIEKRASSSPDNRWFALAYDVMVWLSSLGLQLPFSPIETLHLSHEKSYKTLLFCEKDLAIPFVSAMVGAQDFYHHLSCYRDSLKTIQFLCPDEVIVWERKPGTWQLHLSSGIKLEVPLVIAADGKDSAVRFHQGIWTKRWTYPQKAWVFTFAPFPPKTAYEHFFDGGSLALLPIVNNQGAGIWISTMPPEDLTKTMSPFLSSPPSWVSPPSLFSIYAQNTWPIALWRCILLGDAAQVVHPIAGQGLTVSLRTVESFVSFLVKRRDLGLDIGEGLSSFQKTWAYQSLPMQAATAAIVYGFSLGYRKIAKYLWPVVCHALSPSLVLRQTLMRYATFGKI